MLWIININGADLEHQLLTFPGVINSNWIKINNASVTNAHLPENKRFGIKANE
jgi:hypothetical protein